MYVDIPDYATAVFDYLMVWAPDEETPLEMPVRNPGVAAGANMAMHFAGVTVVRYINDKVRRYEASQLLHQIDHDNRMVEFERPDPIKKPLVDRWQDDVNAIVNLLDFVHGKIGYYCHEWRTWVFKPRDMVNAMIEDGHIWVDKRRVETAKFIKSKGAA